MRVVIDTNILVSAIMSPAGAARQVLRLCLDGSVTPLLSNTLLLEYEDVCSRDALFVGAKIDAPVRGELFDAMIAACQWVPIYYLWRPNLRDEGDNHLMELAVGGSASSIVTFNKRDFDGSALAFPQIAIQTASEFVHERSSRR